MRSEVETARKHLWLPLAAAVCTAVAGCGQQAAPQGSSSAASPTGVSVVHPERKSLRRVVEQPGSVQPYEETQLFARVSGYVSKLHADIGQKVRGPKYDRSGQEVEPGEVLAEISVPEMVEEVSQKKALTRQAGGW